MRKKPPLWKIAVFDSLGNLAVEHLPVTWNLIGGPLVQREGRRYWAYYAPDGGTPRIFLDRPVPEFTPWQ